MNGALLGNLPGGHAVVWQREAARLFGEYWRTGNLKHLGAFIRHVRGMRGYLGRLAR